MAENDENETNLDNKTSKFLEARSKLTDELVEKWTQEQTEMRKRLELHDTEPWEINRKVYDASLDANEGQSFSNESLRYVAGLDISFVKDENTACSGLYVFDISQNMKLVYEDLDKELIIMDQPYVPGFLAYREAPFLLRKLDKLKKEKPYLYPHCIFIDGNGLLHSAKFGMACHIGVLSNTPTIGCSKKLFSGFGIENNQEHKDKIKKKLKRGGDYFELRSNEPDEPLLGYCYRATSDAPNPIYVSIGNKISWETCLWLLSFCFGKGGWKYRVPEPIRQADIRTREYLAKNYSKT